MSVFDHGLLYGDGVFEGIRYYRRKAFRMEEHLDRLERSAKAICLTLPYHSHALAEAIAATVDAAGNEEGYIRLVITRGRGPLGIDPSGCERPNLFILASPLTMATEEVRLRGARVIIAATRRLPADGLDPRVKSLNYLNHIMARMEAIQAHADEAILLNGQGRVAEGTADNVFIVKDGTLLTPPAVEGALDGVTRGIIFELAGGMAIPAREAPLTPYDLYTADECFLTGTATELLPVRELNGRPLATCPGVIFEKLLLGFRQLTGRAECASDPTH